MKIDTAPNPQKKLATLKLEYAKLSEVLTALSDREIPPAQQAVYNNALQKEAEILNEIKYLESNLNFKKDAQIENSNNESIDDMARIGKVDSELEEKSDIDTGELEEPTLEAEDSYIEELEQEVDRTREKYIKESGEHRKINQIRNQILNSKIYSFFYKSEVFKSKQAYDEARENLENELYAENNEEIEKSNLTQEEIEVAKQNFQADLINKITVEEVAKINTARNEKLGTYKANLVDKALLNSTNFVKGTGAVLGKVMSAYKKTGNYGWKIIDHRGEMPENADELTGQADAKITRVNELKNELKKESDETKRDELKNEIGNLKKEAAELRDEAKGRVIYQYKMGQLIRSTLLFGAGGMVIGGGIVGASIIGFAARTARGMGIGLAGTSALAATENKLRGKIDDYEQEKLQAEADLKKGLIRPMEFEKIINSIHSKETNVKIAGAAMKTVLVGLMGVTNVMSGSGKFSFGKLGTINTGIGQNWDKSIEGGLRSLLHGNNEPSASILEGNGSNETLENKDEVNNSDNQNSETEDNTVTEEQTTIPPVIKVEPIDSSKFMVKDSTININPTAKIIPTDSTKFAVKDSTNINQNIKTAPIDTNRVSVKDTVIKVNPEVKIAPADTNTVKVSENQNIPTEKTNIDTKVSIPKEAIIDAKHPGYTYTWKAQIEAPGSKLDAQKIADSIGYKGDIHKPGFYKALGEKLGYISEKGGVQGTAGTASVLKFEDGKLSADEYSPDGKLMETHVAGEDMENDFKDKGSENYEKVYQVKETIKAGTENNTKINKDEAPDPSKPGKVIKNSSDSIPTTPNKIEGIDGPKENIININDDQTKLSSEVSEAYGANSFFDNERIHGGPNPDGYNDREYTPQPEDGGPKGGGRSATPGPRDTRGPSDQPNGQGRSTTPNPTYPYPGRNNTPDQQGNTDHPAENGSNMVPETQIQRQNLNAGIDAIFGQKTGSKHVFGIFTKEWSQMKNLTVEEALGEHKFLHHENNVNIKQIKHVISKSGLDYYKIDPKTGNKTMMTLEEAFIKLESQSDRQNFSVVEYYLRKK